jgi:hypothetical protein
MTIRPSIARVAFLCALACAACGDSGFSTAPDEDPQTCSGVQRVVINPSTVTLGALGATAQLTAAAYDQSGDAVSGVNMSWKSLNTAIATVSASGVVTARSVGTVLLVAGAGSCTATDTLAVSVEQVVSSVAVNPPSTSVGTGSSVTLQALVVDSLGSPVQGANVTWSSSNPAVATVDQSGTVSAAAAGSVTINAASSGKTGAASIAVSGSAPPPSNSGAPDIAATDFDNGLLAPFTTGGGQPSSADIYVADDPTGKLSGKVAHIRFERSSTGTSVDVNRAIRYVHSSGIGLGQTVFVRGDVVIPSPAATMSSAMRKLIYVQRNQNDESFAVLKADGNNLKAEITNNRVFSGGAIPFDTKVSIELQITVNSSPGAADGVFRVWKDGVLVIDASNVIWLTSSTPFTRFLFGQQTQHQQHDSSILFSEMRYWDRIALSTKRIGP